MRPEIPNAWYAWYRDYQELRDQHSALTSWRTEKQSMEERLKELEAENKRLAAEKQEMGRKIWNLRLELESEGREPEGTHYVPGSRWERFEGPSCTAKDLESFVDGRNIRLFPTGMEPKGKPSSLKASLRLWISAMSPTGVDVP